jgi:hypothetical protein
MTTASASMPANTHTPAMRRLGQSATQSAKAEVTAFASPSARAQPSASVQADPAQTVQGSAHTKAKRVDAENAEGCEPCVGADCIRSGPVLAVLAARRDGASINAAARASGINYRTAQRIVEGAAGRRQRQLVAVG